MFNQYKILKQKLYSVTDKLAVIASINHGEGQAYVSHNKGVTKSTICGSLRDEEKLNDFVYMINSTDSMIRKKVRTVKDLQLGKAVFAGLIMERAALFSIFKLRNCTTFYMLIILVIASRVWLHYFQYHHRITQVKINGEARSADKKS